MIIVNVKVPALEKEYNFSLDEDAPVGELIEETAELIVQKEGVQFIGNLDEMALCSREGCFQCSKRGTLRDYGICGGEELILV
ncbi:MAG: hypothetical protein IJT94_17445 [Oscillibacter sp.]|nr:hypothetical protein [Oscillibacter sp.]MBQ9349096.1 hypothetical protein [Oscillibacter sp.]